MTIHQFFRCLITSQWLTDSWPPHSVVHLVTRATLCIVAAGVNGIFYHQRSSRKAWSLQRFVCARQLSFRLPLRAGDGSDTAFSHLRLLPASPDRRAWAPLSWTGRLTLGVSVAWLPAMVSGRARWIRLYQRLVPQAAVTFPYSPSSFQTFAPLRLEHLSLFTTARSRSL